MDYHCNYYAMDDPIPSAAYSTHFTANNGRSGTFYVWPSRGRWYWSALGNNGVCDTEQQAAAAARLWIRDRVVKSKP